LLRKKIKKNRQLLFYLLRERREVDLENLPMKKLNLKRRS